MIATCSAANSSRAAPSRSRASTATAAAAPVREDRGSHTICAVVTAEFLEHQLSIGNDLVTPMPVYGFPGLTPGDRWCVTAANWLRAHEAGAAAYVVLASTHERALELVPLAALQEHAVDVPLDPGAFGD